MSARRKERELAFQVFYEAQVGSEDVVQVRERFLKKFNAEEEDSSFACELVKGVSENLDRIDIQLASCTQNWLPARMMPVDRNIMRVAVYELMYCDDIAPAVSINEAIEIAKKYGTEKSGAFVNGVLDCVRKKLKSG